MQLTVFDKNGKKLEKKLKVSDKVFKTEINDPLMSQAVYIYLSNQREANAHTKDRGDVSGGGRKPWKQKGTGRARHGSSRSPIWRKGGVTFGPTNQRNFKKNFSTKMRKEAIRSAFSYQAKENKVSIFEEMAVGKTKLTQNMLEVIKKSDLTGKILIIENVVNDSLIKAVGNLKRIKVTLVTEINTYTLLNYDNIVILEGALPKIEEFWGEAKKETKSEEIKK